MGVSGPSLLIESTDSMIICSIIYDARLPPPPKKKDVKLDETLLRYSKVIGRVD